MPEETMIAWPYDIPLASAEDIFETCERHQSLTHTSLLPSRLSRLVLAVGDWNSSSVGVINLDPTAHHGITEWYVGTGQASHWIDLIQRHSLGDFSDKYSGHFEDALFFLGRNEEPTEIRQSADWSFLDKALALSERRSFEILGYLFYEGAKSFEEMFEAYPKEAATFEMLARLFIIGAIRVKDESFSITEAGELILREFALIDEAGGEQPEARDAADFTP